MADPRKAGGSGCCEGKEFSFGELEKLAASEEPFRSLIDPDAPEFAPSGNVPRRIREFCKRTGQPVPGDRGPAGALHQ